VKVHNFCARPSIEHLLSAEVRRRYCGTFQIPNMRYRWKCGEVYEGATLLWAKISSTKYALSVKVRWSYCGS